MLGADVFGAELRAVLGADVAAKLATELPMVVLCVEIRSFAPGAATPGKAVMLFWLALELMAMELVIPGTGEEARDGLRIGVAARGVKLPDRFWTLEMRGLAP